MKTITTIVWEYKVVDYDLDELTRLGKLGWEHYLVDGEKMFFKRDSSTAAVVD